ncbi:MAG: histidine--tRNA ligase [Balneola sp.]|nr:histidine--tRNA ligase [Balneola sp.]MBO6651079.1 histidine--tRNA ligase [Balneola sp.]MBO6712793.1 histidine--tRNA ligase [Balneola sp.]MBO6801092.1 histidine--tRNA ligase [Balneola sp.]MBO6871284.1 histidine--tRNA ligase [Balneola sp.]
MAKPNYTTHLGMLDILPDESPKWRALENIIHEEAAKFNFEEIRTPIMEQTELIKRGIGQLTDIVTKEIFAFTKGDSNYVLRPELTAPVVRAYVQHHLDQRGGSQKLYYIGPMFRAERPQKGRQRQFHQFGVEVIGTDNPVADVECIAFMMRIYQRIGIKNFELKLNSVGDPESRENYKSVLKEYLKPHFDELSELSQKRFEKNPMRILDSKEPEDQQFIKNAPVISDHLNEESKVHFQQVCEMLSSLNIEYTLDPLLVRGMDYYTRTAFELTSPDLGSQDALAGGGRYDLLVEEIGGKPTPAVGFAAGMERLFIACEELEISLAEEKKVDVFIVSLGDDARNWALKTLPILRQNGISATMDYLDRSMRAQMKDANRENAYYTLIVGDNELQDGKFTLRNMKESEEAQLTIDEIVSKLSQ